jgi:hypothetical protein
MVNVDGDDHRVASALPALRRVQGIGRIQKNSEEVRQCCVYNVRIPDRMKRKPDLLEIPISKLLRAGAEYED